MRRPFKNALCRTGLPDTWGEMLGREPRLALLMPMFTTHDGPKIHAELVKELAGAVSVGSGPA